MRFLAEFASSRNLTALRVPELQAAAQTLGIALTVVDDGTYGLHRPRHDGAPHRAEEDEYVPHFCIFDVPRTDDATAIASRCVLLRAVHVFLGGAPTLHALIHAWGVPPGEEPGPGNETAEPSATAVLRGEPVERYCRDKDLRYTCSVHTYGAEHKHTWADIAAVITAVTQRVLRHTGVVDTKHPAQRFAVFFEYDEAAWRRLQREKKTMPTDAVKEPRDGVPSQAPQALPSDGASTDTTAVPVWNGTTTLDAAGGGMLRRVYVAMLVSESGRRDLLSRYELKRRPYVGTTSMPPEMTFAMANLAGIRRGSVVCDPFCGTGSTLVAAAHWGAITFGTDMDGRTMRNGSLRSQQSPQTVQQRRVAMGSYSEQELCEAGITTQAEREAPSVATNFKLYGLPWVPERIRMNFSQWECGGWRPCLPALRCREAGFLDAIVSDPPYGVREQRKRSHLPAAVHGGECDGAADVAHGNAVLTAASGRRSPMAYDTSSVVLDLVMFAASALVVGGRLTFWHPTTDAYTDEEIPQHPCMRVVSNAPQRLSLKLVRRLVTMEKIRSLAEVGDVSRAACAPRKGAEDLRVLMEATALPDNLDYTEYREKKRRKFDASVKYREGQRDQAEARNITELKQPRTRRETRAEAVANRERKILAGTALRSSARARPGSPVECEKQLDS